MKIITRVAIIALITFCFTVAASAATFVVNTTNDTQDTTPGDGVCSDGSNCSLRAAITEANALTGADIITLPAGTYTQTLVSANDNTNLGGDLDITTDMTINGAGSGTTFVQANAAAGVAIERVFDVRAGATATLAGMTIRHGRFTGTMTADTRGAGVENLGTLTINSCIITLNQINSTNGNPLAAGINNGTATLTLTNTTVTQNINTRVTGGSAFGGGIGSTGTSTMTITNSSITNNSAISQAGGFGLGAGLYLQDTFTVNASGSHFDSNTGTGTSGSNGDGVRALSNIGAATFNATNCTFNNNVGAPGSATSLHQGVGLQLFTATGAAATLTSNIINSTISGNTGNSVGVGMNVTINGSTLNLNFTGSTLSGNSTTGTVNSFGGGAFISNAASTFTSPGTLNFTNSTISGNTADQGGGGLAFEQPTAGVVTVNMNFMTVAGNRANNDNAGTDGGGGIIQASGTLNMKNSIVADNTVGTGGTGVDILGAVTSQDFNHIENTTGATITGSTANNTTGDPNLGALANNGGPTLTQLPNVGSPVINSIPSGTNDCGTVITTDQRGLTRPAGGACEKGSTERQVVNTQHYLDFDGDGKTDFAHSRVDTFQPNGQMFWYILNSGGTTKIEAWGLGADSLVPGDFDGDNKTDIAVFRGSIGGWYIVNSQTGTVRVESFGVVNDQPVVGDYDGDGKDDIAVFRPSNGTWYWRTITNGPVFGVNWGTTGDTAAPGDYDGDGKNDFVIRRNEGGQNRFWRALSGGTTDSVLFGNIGDKLVQGDFDGDGKSDLAIARVVSGQLLWWIHPSSGGADVAQFWGLTSDWTTPGDYDGDGKTDIAIWRPNGDPAQNFFYVLGTTSGFFTQEWGENTDHPVNGQPTP